MNDNVKLFPAQYEDIEARLLLERHLRSITVPRFTPPKWWECDVCEITANGYFREFEIKMSRADFKVDAQKSREVWEPGVFSRCGDPPRPIEKKHDLLARGDPRGPVEFYFVTPAGLLSETEIPTWAGFIEIIVRADIAFPVERIVKKAPRLHRQKADPQVADYMRGACYGRLHAVWSSNYHRWRCDRLTRAEAQLAS